MTLSKLQSLKIEVEGADEKLIKADHFVSFSSLFENGKLPPESIIIPFFITNLPSHYTSICNRFYGKGKFHELNDLDNFNKTTRTLSKKISGRELAWFNSKIYKTQFEKFSSDLELNETKKQAIKKIIFNYFASTIYEDFFRDLELPRTIISIIDERQELAQEINNHINEIINRISLNEDYSSESYRIGDNLLKKTRREIKVNLLGKDFGDIPTDSPQFEFMNRFLIKKLLFPLSFRPSKKENISYNHLIYSLYLQFRSQNETNYMPQITKTIDFIRNLSPLKNKIPATNKRALQKKIKDLIKKNRHLKDSHIRNLQKLEKYLDDEFPGEAILNDFF